MNISAIKVIAILSLVLPNWVATAQFEALDLDRIFRSTVYIMQARDVDNNLLITCVGSGTIVSRDGLVLTNANSILVSDTCPGDVLIVALSDDITRPPVAQYRAEIVQLDSGLDLGILRINRKLDGNLIDRSSLALPFVELADSSNLKLDETITVVGYPGIGNESVNAVRGTLSGFISEPRSLNIGPTWLKTNSSIPATMTGGGAYNQNSELIGIPTTAPVSRILNQEAGCIPLQDTNKDDLVNSDDLCIPVGEFINALRPSNFARPLLRSAVLGLNVSVNSTVSQQTSLSIPPEISRLFFAASVNEAGMPTTVISSLPAGSTSLYLFFDYKHMTPDTTYELRVTSDNVLNSTFSLAPVRWSGGQHGMWYIGSTGQAWPNGIYQFAILANGTELASKRLIIGEAPSSTSGFSDIVFGLLDTRGNPQGNGFVLPAGNIASARFLYNNMQDGLIWSAIWYLDDTEFQRISSPWTAGTSGSQTTSIEVTQGLPPGRYRLELYIEDRLAATSDFTIAGAQNGALTQIFTNLYSTTADTDAEAFAATPQSNLPNTTENLYVLFDWQQIAPGTLWTIQWSVDREIFFQGNLTWSNELSGSQFMIRLLGSNRIPDGTYTMDILVNNLKLASNTVQVGIGQLPIDQFGSARGVQMRGQILDLETRRGVPSVTVIIVSADFSVADFQWQQDQVFASATTDSQGNFIINRPLELSSDSQPIAYSAIVVVKGYLPISADGIEVDANTPNPLNIVLYLSRD